MALQYSPSKSSKVSKRPSSKSPIKSFQKDVRKILLPSTKVYKDAVSNQKLQSPTTLEDNKLTVKDYKVKLDYQQFSGKDIMVAIDTILNNKWAESTQLHNRYPTKLGTMEERIFGLRGLSNASKTDILKFRRNFPMGLVTTTQLYSIFLNESNTFVDKSLESHIRSGKLKKIVISNAAPIISRSVNKFQSGKVTYGFENVELVVKSDSYFSVISGALRSKKHSSISSLDKFMKYLKEHPTALYISYSADNGGFTAEEITYLINSGFVTLASNHLIEIETNVYSISYPGCGAYLKLVNSGRSWLVKVLGKNKHKELLEDQIISKWEGVNATGESKMNNFRSPFYGYDLNWVLADALGAGVVEVFNTPVGRGWRLTGKI
ncbi:Serine-threonine protein kinase 19 family protein [Candida albicans]|uniref:Serine-threonine protein kinase 19 family protein n=1 Tax=Candida albicans TaxID=5476 RepID=A0A8H6C2W5_CANAX|nr:Serine-threonine protein kinase 19 family protein [Candida albicans]